MALSSFIFSPVFFSVMGFVFFIRSKFRPKAKHIQLVFLVLFSFTICFVYPLTGVYITNSYNIFDDFFLFCFISSLVAVAINILYLIVRGIKNERN